MVGVYESWGFVTNNSGWYCRTVDCRDEQHQIDVDSWRRIKVQRVSQCEKQKSTVRYRLNLLSIYIMVNVVMCRNKSWCIVIYNHFWVVKKGDIIGLSNELKRECSLSELCHFWKHNCGITSNNTYVSYDYDSCLSEWGWVTQWNLTCMMISRK